MRLGRMMVVAIALAALAPQPVRASDFVDFVAGFRPEAMAHGISPALFDQVFATLTPDPSLSALTRRQPEFAKPLGAYLAAQVTPARVVQGQALLRRWAGPLAAIERQSGVPAAIVVAVWGLETNYGAASGDKDVIRSMATLAALKVRPDLYRNELIAALTLLQTGEVARDQLRGSWAGAMGQPQFMPSSFIAYAVDGDGDGRRDIWGDVPDALASIGNFLRAKGWQGGAPWGMQVRVPKGLDPMLSRADFSQWRTRGVKRVDGAPLPAAGEGILFYPAGAAGPAFLVTPNAEVLKTYNFSDAYVLSVAELADRMAGGAAFVGPWPTAVGLARPDRIALQARLAALGYAVDDRQGRISLALRDTIRAAQKAVGLTPDGEPTEALLRALDAPSSPGAKPK